MHLSQIVAPYGGQLKRTGPNEVTITVNEMSGVVAIISNVDFNVDEKEASLRDSDLLICLSMTSCTRNIIMSSHLHGYNVAGQIILLQKQTWLLY